MHPALLLALAALAGGKFGKSCISRWPIRPHERSALTTTCAPWMVSAGKEAGTQVVFLFFGGSLVMKLYSQSGHSWSRGVLISLALSAVVGAMCLMTSPAFGQRVVPGSGELVTNCGDDFEGNSWKYFPNFPKSSRNIDEEERAPLGQSANRRWLEGPHRGTPDVLRRVATPDRGLRGSEYSLLMQTRRPGIPGKATNEPQQDDLMVKVKRRVGHPIPAEWSPSCVVRVYVPPFDEWENRTGASFGFRTDCWGRRPNSDELEQFWPGLFFNFRSETSRNVATDSAYMALRSDVQGRDRRGPDLEPGWWTLGLSVSPDGMCHFYAKQGVRDLTEEDHLDSYFCYGYRVERMDLFFFNLVTMDNGHSTSTSWIIDDPEFYCFPPASYNRKATYAGGKDANVRIPSTTRRSPSNRGGRSSRYRR